MLKTKLNQLNSLMLQQKGYNIYKIVLWYLK